MLEAPTAIFRVDVTVVIQLQIQVALVKRLKPGGLDRHRVRTAYLQLRQDEVSPAVTDLAFVVIFVLVFTTVTESDKELSRQLHR